MLFGGGRSQVLIIITQRFQLFVTLTIAILFLGCYSVIEDMPSLPCRAKGGVEYSRFTMKELRKFVGNAGRYYNYPYSPFCMRLINSMNTMDPYFVLAKDFLHFGDGPLKSKDDEEAQAHLMLSLFASPVIPALESLLANFPFDIGLEIDMSIRGVQMKNEVGWRLLELTPRIAQALYESFYRGLLGPITSADQFVPDIMSRPNISGPGPIVIVGNPRTGTSLLQFLLSLDKEHNRTPTNWEFKNPSSILPDKDRIELGQPLSSAQGSGRWRELQADHPAEDNILFELVGSMGVNTEGDNEAQDWARWNINRDHIALMCLHRLMIRLLECQDQHRNHNGSKQWIFKDPSYLGHTMEAITEVYPNVRFVWMHRNLNDVVASNFRLAPQLEEDPAHGFLYTSALLSFQRQGMAFRQTGKYLVDGDMHTGGEKHKSYNTHKPPESQEHRFHDIFLEDLHSDPVAEIRKLYDKWDMPFTEKYEAAIRAWEASSEKRDAIQAKRFPLGLKHLDDLAPIMMKNQDYFQRFPRTTPKGVHVIGLLDDEL